MVATEAGIEERTCSIGFDCVRLGTLGTFESIPSTLSSNLRDDVLCPCLNPRNPNNFFLKISSSEYCSEFAAHILKRVQSAPNPSVPWLVPSVSHSILVSNLQDAYSVSRRVEAYLHDKANSNRIHGANKNHR